MNEKEITKLALKEVENMWMIDHEIFNKVKDEIREKLNSKKET